MFRSLKLILPVLISLLFNNERGWTHPQTGWEVVNSQNMAFYFIQTAYLDNVELESQQEDAIGVFFNDQCIGWGFYNSGISSVPTTGDDGTMPAYPTNGDSITFKFYDSERDSAQCPPTPSAMGLYPLFQPGQETDSSFQTPQNLIVGHDGSKTPLFGDRRDQIILEFENRIYNSAKKEFRNANSIAYYSSLDVKPGYFRNTDFEITDWYDLLNLNFRKVRFKKK